MISWHCAGNSAHIFQINQVQVKCWFFKQSRNSTHGGKEIFFNKSEFKKVICQHERFSWCNGKKDTLKRRDKSINVKFSLHQAAPYDLDITVLGQSFGEFVYDVRAEGNMINLFEYKIVKDTRYFSIDEKYKNVSNYDVANKAL